MRERYLCRGACSGRSRDGLGRGQTVTATRRFCKVRISWQAQCFRKVKDRFRGRRSTFARSGTDFVAGAVLSQGQAQISRYFRKVRYRFRGRRSTFARLGTDFVAGGSSTDFVAGAVFRDRRFDSILPKSSKIEHKSSIQPINHIQNVIRRVIFLQTSLPRHQTPFSSNSSTHLAVCLLIMFSASA